MKLENYSAILIIRHD
jgi:hypothetical protein